MSVGLPCSLFLQEALLLSPLLLPLLLHEQMTAVFAMSCGGMKGAVLPRQQRLTWCCSRLVGSCPSATALLWINCIGPSLCLLLYMGLMVCVFGLTLQAYCMA